MLIVAGYSRTGTSILFKCLEKSGFYGGTEKQLFGHYYKTQHIEFGNINKQILIWMRDLGIEIPLRRWDVPEQLFPILCQLGNELEEQGINLIKDPQSALTMQLWIDIVPQFKKPKFIKIERDPLDVAKSCVRLWTTQDWLKRMGRKHITVQEVEKQYKRENRFWNVYCKFYDSIKLQYGDLFDKNGTQKKVSDFIGCEFDMSLIDSNKTYAKSKKIY